MAENSKEKAIISKLYLHPVVDEIDGAALELVLAGRISWLLLTSVIWDGGLAYDCDWNDGWMTLVADWVVILWKYDY